MTAECGKPVAESKAECLQGYANHSFCDIEMVIFSLAVNDDGIFVMHHQFVCSRISLQLSVLQSVLSRNAKSYMQFVPRSNCIRQQVLKILYAVCCMLHINKLHIYHQQYTLYRPFNYESHTCRGAMCLNFFRPLRMSCKHCKPSTHPDYSCALFYIML